MHNIIECYTDCSYSPQTKLCVIGYQILIPNQKNKIKTELLINVKNIQGEIYAVEKCIETCKKIFDNQNYKLLIHTDCKRVIKNVYANVEFIKMEGHKRKNLKNNKDIIFSNVDKKVRNDLRKHVKIYKNNS